MKKRTLAYTYAKVLCAICKDQRQMGMYLTGLELINKTLAGNASLKSVLSAPGVDVREKRNVLETLFKEEIDSQLLFFIKKLIEKNLIGLLPDILCRFRHLVATEMDILHVRALSAIPLTTEERKTLLNKLSASTDKTVELAEELNPNILGGIKLMYSTNKMLDFSIKSQLERLKNVLQKKGLQHATESR